MAKLPTYEEMAQEVAERALDECEYEGKTLREWIEIIKAQHGTNLAEVGTDLISRQAAIDVLERVKTATSENGERWIAKINAQMELEQLPHAQPEIIRCKDCKHYWIHKCMDSMPIERCDLEQTLYDAEHDFCSLAERREVTT